jgi:diguanylate cyclase (GGDEF)-like protein
MGKNSDKRRARKLPPSGPATPALDDVTAAVDVDEVHRSPPAWAQRTGIFDIPSADHDTSLARALFHVTCLVSLREGQEGALDRVAAEIASMVEADTVTLLRLDRGDDVLPARLTVLAQHGLHVSDAELVRFDLADGIAGHVASTGQVVRVEDAPRDERFTRLHGQRTEVGSLVAVPMRFGARLVGVLAVSRREIRGFHDVDTDRLGVIGDSLAQDIEQARLLREALTDPLTGLHSRLALLTSLPREVETARRYQLGLSLLLIDVDGLRAVNATHGRGHGDRVLVDAAHTLAGTLRGADLCVRFGADELAVLLPMTHANNARATAKRLMKLLNAIPSVGDKVTFSIGIASLDVVDEDALALLWRADRALAEAKRQGGDRIAAAHPERRETEA